jgi:regulator of cell morphogenesis and NO signaling
MYAHIEKEEQVLFPFISQMDQESIVSYPPAHACFRSVAHPIFMMEQEHEAADHIMQKLILITNHFEAPSWACATHISLFSGLRGFAEDLKQHVHLENDVLFPRAIQSETLIKARS